VTGPFDGDEIRDPDLQAASLATATCRGRGVDTIICDVGDVVILFPPERSAEIERRHGIPMGELLKTVLKSPPGRLATIGRIDLDEWFRQVSSLVGKAAVRDWLDYHGDLNQPMVEILTAARSSGVRVLLLSNASARLWDDLDHHGIRDLADQVFCSADIGVAKPDPRAYEFVLGTASVAADRALYIDDTASWVEAGRGVGLRGYRYGTPAGVRRELAALGVAV
jgi:HAD superfamily hydrolase (TIGR01509 family)